MTTFEEKIKEAITGKAFDRCLNCQDEAVKEIKKATEEEMENRIRRLGADIVKCSKCGAEMIWIKSKTGKSLPVRLNLINHFADCPNAEEFRNKNGLPKRTSTK